MHRHRGLQGRLQGRSPAATAPRASGRRSRGRILAVLRAGGLLAPAVVLLVWARTPVEAAGGAAPSWHSPHAEALRAHRDRPPLPDLLGDGGVPRVPLRGAPKGAAARPVVFGFLPYWIDRTYYHAIDWGLLSHVAPFSVEVNPDGRLGDLHGWPWTALVDTAHAHGVRVILTATLFGDSRVLALIGHAERRQRFFVAVGDAVLAGNADGVIVDFEGPGANGWPARIAGFLAELRAALQARIPGTQVSFAAPPVDWGGRWDMAGLAAAADYLFIMGYAWTGSWSDRSGPTAPLTGGSRNLTTTLTDGRDFGDVTRDEPGRLILGVPLYGCRWRTTAAAARAPTTAFLDYPRFWETALKRPRHEALWDADSQTPWYRYQEGGAWVQVWHDDATSLGLKFDLALDRGLRGVGLWALGYESRRPETWRLIAERIGRRSPPPTVVVGVGVAPLAPAELRLDPGYPNPFNGSVHLRAQVPGAGDVELVVYDLRGRRLRRWRTWLDAAGPVEWAWDGTDARGRAVASGVYLARLRHRAPDGGRTLRSRRLVLVR